MTRIEDGPAGRTSSSRQPVLANSSYPFLACPLLPAGGDHHVEVTELGWCALVGAGDDLLDYQEHSVRPRIQCDRGRIGLARSSVSHRLGPEEVRSLIAAATHRSGT